MEKMYRYMNPMCPEETCTRLFNLLLTNRCTSSEKRARQQLLVLGQRLPLSAKWSQKTLLSVKSLHTISFNTFGRGGKQNLSHRSNERSALFIASNLLLLPPPESVTFKIVLISTARFMVYGHEQPSLPPNMLFQCNPGFERLRQLCHTNGFQLDVPFLI